MDISTVTSKRRRRTIGISYIEPGLPHVEIIINGKKINVAENPYNEHSIIRIPFNIQLFHRNLVVRKLTKYLSSLQQLPDKYLEYKNKKIEKLHVKKLIIGGGTSGISSLDEGSLLITRDLIGDFEYDNSPIPEMDRNELFYKIKEKIKTYNEKIIIGTFIGKFDEGLLFELNNKYLLVSTEKILVSVGGRTIRPLFKNNYTLGIVSREFYLKKLKQKYKHITVLGFTNIAARTALNAEKALILIPRDIKLRISKFYLEQLEEKGIEVINDDILNVKKRKNEIEIITQKNNKLISDLVVFSVVKQPRIEISFNLGLDYKFNEALHIYQPISNNTIKATGGALGIMDEYVSFLSGIDSLENSLVREYEPGLLGEEPYQLKSPYKYGNDGLICECEDLDMKDIYFSLSLNLNDVESIKRVSGLATGHCQGKVCSYLTGSLVKSQRLISFRSPLYPVNL